MKAVPKVVLIRRLIRTIFCLKGSKAATAETVHNIHERLKTKKLLLSHTDAPVMFVKLSCVLVLDSLKMSRWKSCTALFSLQQNVRPLRLAPPSSMQCRKCYVLLYLQGRSQGNRLPIMLWSASQPRLLSCQHLCHAALRQLELLLSLNNLIDEFFLFPLLYFHSLTRALCH